jgi:lipoprotein LprG
MTDRRRSSIPVMSRLRSVLALFAVLVALASCNEKPKTTESKPAENLPAGDALLKESAAAMREIKTAQFLITADGAIAGLSLRRAEGTLTREGSAKGTAQLDQSGSTVELTFVIVGDKIYVKGPTGGYQSFPLQLAASVYDPSAILDPQRGIAKVLSTATGATTEASEAVDGKDAWRVAATTNGTYLATVIPGVKGSIPGKVWIAASDKRLLKAAFTLPGTGGNGGTVTVTFKEFDAPATISAP